MFGTGRANSIGAVRSSIPPVFNPGTSAPKATRGADRVFDRTGTQQTGPYARLEPKGLDSCPPRGENAADGPVSCAIRAAPIRDARTQRQPCLEPSNCSF